MKYEIKGGSLPILITTLDQGESVFNDKGSMAWMSPGISMDTNTRGGVLKGLKRSLSGESMFLNTYTSMGPGQEIAFASSVPGTIKMLRLDGSRGVICQKGAFLAGDSGINLDIAFTKRFSAGLLGGEGFILQRVSGVGDVALEIDGFLVDKQLAPGEQLLVDQGNVAFFEEGVQYEIVTVKGLKNKFLSGEGMFLVKLTGPGKVGLQSMPISGLASSIIPFIPKPH